MSWLAPERVTVSREALQGTGVESSSRSRSHEEPGGCWQTLVVRGLPGQIGERGGRAGCSRTAASGAPSTAEQDLGDGQAEQRGVGEARRSARALADAKLDEEVVDLDVERGGEGVKFGCHTSRLGALALLVTACFLIAADSESLI